MTMLLKYEGKRSGRRLISCLLMAMPLLTVAQSIETDTRDSAYPMLYRSEQSVEKVSAISYLKGGRLANTPAPSILYGLNGRVTGLHLSQSSGEPSADLLNLSLRGRDPLILIDGIPRATLSINPEQIESVTVLKDAMATAMLGMRAMNGAVLITTRKGEGSKDAFRLGFKAQGGVQAPTRMREYLNAYDYANLYNEALKNDGRPALYSPSELEAYRTGSDPYRYPDVDWTKTLLKDQAGFSRYTLEAEGANRQTNYYVTLDYLNQGGLFRESSDNAYSTNSTYRRYVFRSNLETRINSRFKVFLNLFGRVRNGNEPGVGSENILPDLNTTPNNAYPVFNPNKSLGGNINYQNNLWGQSVRSGYYQTFSRDGFVDAGFKGDLDHLMKGWWVRGTISYNTTLTQDVNRSKQFQVSRMTMRAPGDTVYQIFGPDPLPQQNNSSAVTLRSQQFYAELATGVQRTTGRHGRNFLLLANTDQQTINAELPNRFTNLSSHFQYAYDERFIWQVAAAFSGNSRFEEGQRFGFFPTTGLAWNLHKERWAASMRGIDEWKLRATYGLTGNAVPGYFTFQRGFAGSTGYVFGTSAGSVSGLAETAQPYVRTWEKARQLNLGMDLAFAGRRGWLTAEWFRQDNSDLLQTRGFNSAIMGMAYPMENIGRNHYSGVEFDLGWSGKSGRWGYTLSANFSSVRSRVDFADETARPYPWMARTGYPVGQFYGYVADGFVSAAGGGPVMEGHVSKPGDIKYKDLNGDGLINLYDQRTIGHTRPFMFYGFNLQLRRGRFYADLLFQGTANRQGMITGNTMWEFQSNGLGQAFPHHLSRWTSATAASAIYPRLTVGTNPNNHVTSSFWIEDLSYLRLRNAELGYRIEQPAFLKGKVREIRGFVNGLNLLTLSSFRRADPETPLANYPVQRVVNAGIALTL